MQRCRHGLLLAALIFGCCGCEKNPFTNMLGTDKDATTQAAGESAEESSPDAVASSVDASPIDSSVVRLRQRIGQLFENVLPTLESSRELVDIHDDLPDSSYIPFRADKESNSAAINDLLDQAIEALSVSEVSDHRKQIRDANLAMASARKKIADYRQRRVSASWAKDQGKIDSVNPYELSKEQIDEGIAEEKAIVEGKKQQLIELKKSFATELSKIGIDVDEAGVESLLSSVSGDDIVTMAVVFDNIKHMTAQLQELTDQSGETLDVSKRYYGMYVVMVRVMDRIQKTFMRDINEQHIPKLNQFASQADRNIQRARDLIEKKGGDTELLRSNIASNQLTRETAELYIEYLKHNAKLIAAENKLVQKNLATAMNTYATVKLSSDVAELMESGRRDFETLMKLQIPPLREFSNAAVRREFQRMTSKLRSGAG